jgi:hypothetical protein
MNKLLATTAILLGTCITPVFAEQSSLMSLLQPSAPKANPFFALPVDVQQNKVIVVVKPFPNMPAIPYLGNNYVCEKFGDVRQHATIAVTTDGKFSLNGVEMPATIRMANGVRKNEFGNYVNVTSITQISTYGALPKIEFFPTQSGRLEYNGALYTCI